MKPSKICGGHGPDLAARLVAPKNGSRRDGTNQREAGSMSKILLLVAAMFFSVVITPTPATAETTFGEGDRYCRLYGGTWVWTSGPECPFCKTCAGCKGGNCVWIPCDLLACDVIVLRTVSASKPGRPATFRNVRCASPPCRFPLPASGQLNYTLIPAGGAVFR